MEHGREVRLGLVVYGGVSLAIYINGVALEFFNAVRGRGVYKLLKHLIDADIQVDILSGTSAGGINGILLAYALCNELEFEECADLWREHGAIGKLLRSPDAPALATSLLDSEGYFIPELKRALSKLNSIPTCRRATEEPSPTPEVDLFVTGTNFDGRFSTVIEATGRQVDVKDHRAVFLLKHRHGRKTPFDRDDPSKVEALARLAAITSCFPVAFSPVRVRAATDSTTAPGTADEHLTEWGKLDGDAYFIDGGVLDNKPFSYTIGEIFRRVATRPVDRRLFFVEPDPERFARAKGGAQMRATIPSVVETAVAALVAIPGYESIAEDLRNIARRNDKLERYQKLAVKLSDKILALCDHPEAMSASMRAMHTEVRLIQLRERIMRGIAGGDHVDDPGMREWCSELVRRFESWEGRGDDTLEKFDVYFRIRRLFALIYRIEKLVREAKDQRRADRLRRLWHVMNRQLKLLEVVQHHLENLADDLLAGAAKQDGADTAVLWTRLDDAGRALLSFSRNELPPCYRELSVVARTAAGGSEGMPDWLPSRELTDLHEKLGVRRRERDGRSESPGGENLLVIADRMTRELLRAYVVDEQDELHRVWDCFAVFDAHFFAIEYFAELGEKDAIKVVRVSPADAERGFCRARTLEDKVTGEALGHFAAFFKRSWRSNDILWGRLDGMCRVLDALLEPKSVARTMSDGERRRRLRELIAPSAALDPAVLFPNAGARGQETCARWLSQLCDDDDGVRQAALRDPAWAAGSENLLACAQLETLCTDVPKVLEDAAREQLEWNEYRIPDAARADDERPAFVVENRTFSSGRADFDGLAVAIAGGKLVKDSFDELLRADTSTAEGPQDTAVGRFFTKEYHVGRESIRTDIPPFVVFEILTTALIVVRNCLLNAFPVQAGAVKQNPAFKMLIDYPLRAAHAFTYLARRAPATAQAVSLTLWVCSLGALAIVATNSAIVWNGRLHPTPLILMVLVPLLLLGPGGRLLWVRSQGIRWPRVVVAVLSGVLGLLALALLVVTLLVSGPAIVKTVARSLGDVIPDGTARSVARLGLILAAVFAVVGPWLARFAIWATFARLRELLVRAVARPPAGGGSGRR